MSIANFSRCTLGSYAVIIMLAGCGESHSPAVPQLSPIIMYAIPHTSKKTFHYTGAAQTFTVPAHVTELTVTAAGASGASGGPSSGYGGQGGMGGLVRATIPVKSGEKLAVYVGGSGSDDGFNGGASGGGASGDGGLGGTGGGASDVRQNGASLDDRVIVAGGGGGGAVGNAPNAGGDGAPGGASVGGKGQTGRKKGKGLESGGGGGGGGRQNAGGKGGAGGAAGLSGGDACAGDAGTKGGGGPGGCGSANWAQGGGGGGGYFGGGGGGQGGAKCHPHYTRCKMPAAEAAAGVPLTSSLKRQTPRTNEEQRRRVTALSFSVGNDFKMQLRSGGRIGPGTSERQHKHSAITLRPSCRRCTVQRAIHLS